MRGIERDIVKLVKRFSAALVGGVEQVGAVLAFSAPVSIYQALPPADIDDVARGRRCATAVANQTEQARADNY